MPAIAQDATPKFEIQPPHGRPGFMVKVEISNCKHDAAKAPADTQSDAFIACMEKLGYKVEVKNAGDAAAPDQASGAGTPAGTAAPAAGAASSANATQQDDSATYTYAGTVDIGGLRVGMPLAEVRRVLGGEKLTNYDEYTLPLTYMKTSESATVDPFHGQVKPNEVANSTFVNVITTDNRPPLQKTTNARYINQETVDMSSANDHNFFDDVNGKMEYFEADFSPNRGQEVLVGVSHGVYYDWQSKHKGMLLSDLSKGFASKYGVQFPSLPGGDMQAAVWSVSTPDHKLLTTQAKSAQTSVTVKGAPDCIQNKVPIRIHASSYEKLRIGGNFAMESVQQGQGRMGRISRGCGPELLYLTWKVSNPDEPVDRQIVSEYVVGVVAPTLELAGTNKAFDVVQAAMSQKDNNDVKKAAQESKDNKNPF